MCDSISDSVGIERELEFVVNDYDLADALGSGDVAVLGTPQVIAWMEQATLNLAASFLASTCTTVGIHADIRHLAPSLVGDTIVIRAVISEVQGKKIFFDVTASLGDRIVAQGVITRAHVNRKDFESRAGLR